jgi:mono/diheme cytochrome c family protein
MRTVVRVFVTMLLLAVVASVAGLAYVRRTGLSGLPTPGPIETRVARAVRGFAVPAEIKARTNPLGTSEDARTLGKEHFARYCAMCHANDGSGRDTPFGRGLFPKPPDMRSDATQRLTDGELFYIIENGVRFTGMPAFGTGKPDPVGDRLAWQLVTFIRHLPRITADEIGSMESLNPL